MVPQPSPDLEANDPNTRARIPTISSAGPGLDQGPGLGQGLEQGQGLGQGLEQGLEQGQRQGLGQGLGQKSHQKVTASPAFLEQLKKYTTWRLRVEDMQSAIVNHKSF